jgi:mRNA-degrading endonuclease RelE of RelBE toxin-antitoxin system
MAAYLWHLTIESEAKNDIDRLTRPDLFLFFDKLKDLLYADNPTDQQQVTDIKPMSNLVYRDRDIWRKRAGDWRILYRVEVGAITHLKITYKGRLIIVRVLNRRDL